MSSPPSTETHKTAPAWVTVFSVPKMDCPSEENLIRMSLDGLDGIKNLQFDLTKREVTIIHTEDTSNILSRLEPLNFGVKLSSSKAAHENDFNIDDIEIKGLEDSHFLFIEMKKA